MTLTEKSSKLVDPCLVRPSFSGERFMFFLSVFMTMTVGSALLFLLFSDRARGVQTAALVGYTFGVVLYTFSANRRLPRYLFGCPIVRAQLPRLAKRHIAYSAVLVGLLTGALHLRQYLSPWWLTDSGAARSMPPLTITLLIPSACLALTQIMTNRSTLERAHGDAGAGL